ncbi:hypothetical protein DFH06DRAFT_1471732 [Mycena polygramma]|nr:hypothetical protein DFH06DRAFT_1471732 [Mycena polygramma]
MSEPRLPVELERNIFELAARAHSKSIPKLLLVAQRVKIWLEPILYSVVVFSHPIPGHLSFGPTHFSSAIQSQAISGYVKHLFIPYDKVLAIDLELVLASCTAVENLVLPSLQIPEGTDLLPFVSAMPLRRLRTTLADLFFMGGIDFTHSLFTHITHLELMEDLFFAQREDWKGLSLIPNLTHLAFLVKKSLPIFQCALTACSALQVLIFVHIHHLNIQDVGFGLESLAHDTRFICMPASPLSQDWQIGARGGDDFWVRAEKFIAKRVSGEVDSENFVFQDLPDASGSLM